MKIIFFEVEKQEEITLAHAFAGHELLFFPHPLTPQSNLTLGQHANPYDAQIISIFVCSSITPSILDQFRNLKLIITRSTGFDHIDISECKKRSITVLNLPNYAATAVAEFTMALMLALSRKLILASSASSHACPTNPQELRGIQLCGKTLGIIGTGAIGSMVARLAYGFSMTILGFDQRQNAEISEKYGVRYTPLDDLIQAADIITLHTPLTPQTHYLINSTTLNKMKPGVLIVNTARGGVIDAVALVEGLQKGIIGGAALDVLEYECCVPAFSTEVSDAHLENSCCSKHQSLERGRSTVVESSMKTDASSDQERTRLVLCAQQELMHDLRVIVTPHVAYNSKEAVDTRLKDTVSILKEWLMKNS